MTTKNKLNKLYTLGPSLVLLLSLTACQIPGKTFSRWSDELPAGKNLILDFHKSVYTENPDTSILSNGKMDGIVAEVQTAAPNPWQRALRWNIQHPLEQGDVILLVFTARSTYAESESQEAKVGLLFEKIPTWDKSLVTNLNIGTNWREYVVPFEMVMSAPAGEHRLGFNLGEFKQTIEISELKLFNFKKRVSLTELEKFQTKIEYFGQKEDAPWRIDAKKRIEQYRKGDFKITVLDNTGAPVNNAKVGVAMTKHAYVFGAAIKAPYFTEDYYAAHSRKKIKPSDALAYRKVIEENFNSITESLYLKWPHWEDQKQRKQALELLAWTEKRDLLVRGHNIIWPSWQRWARGGNWDFLPKDMYDNRDNKEYLTKRLNSRVDEIVGFLEGRIDEWDVVNEPRVNHDVMDVLGMEAMAGWFCRASKKNPNAKLFLNEYGILSGGGTNRFNHDTLIGHIKLIRKQGCPIHGIGIQGHMGENPTPPTQLLKVLDKFDELGLSIKVTEFTVRTKQRGYQGNYTRDFMTAIFSHPASDGITMWGVWDGDAWVPTIGLWAKDWTLKPNGQAYRNLVFEEWWTDQQGYTDTNGNYKYRGFKGVYKVTVDHQGKTLVNSATFNGNSGELIVRLM